MSSIGELNKFISSINNKSIREFTNTMFEMTTDAYTRPASKNHHLPDERGPGGTLKHTVRAARIMAFLFDISEYSSIDRDSLMSAVILHDCRKFGINSEYGYTVNEHPLLVRRFADKHNLTCDNFEVIMDLIEHHMGKWGPLGHKKAPSISMHAAIHIADCFEARLVEVFADVINRPLKS